MKKKVCAVLFTITMFISYNIYQSQKAIKLSDLALSNIEALATLSEDDKTDFWCCGNTGTCAKGTDEATGEDFEIKGKLNTSPCS